MAAADAADWLEEAVTPPDPTEEGTLPAPVGVIPANAAAIACCEL